MTSWFCTATALRGDVVCVKHRRERDKWEAETPARIERMLAESQELIQELETIRRGYEK